MSTKLVVADDSSLIRNRVTRVTERLPDWQVVASARNGKEALQACAKHQPDAITLDLTMPELDGVACIEQLALRYPQIQILVVSALADKATAIGALSKGAHGFLYKPFTDEQLLDALRELIPNPRPQS